MTHGRGEHAEPASDAPAEGDLPPFHTMTPAEARRAFDARSLRPRRLVPVTRIEDTTIEAPRGAIRARIYGDAAGASPVVVLFHGGGFVLGGIESHEWFARRIAASARATVLSVDYGLSPEHAFPVPLDDAMAAIGWAHEQVPSGGAPRPVVVAGDSAGGNLAAAAALRARDEGGPPIAFQFLAYPMLDARMATESHRSHASGPTITRDHLRWFWGHYLGAGDGASHPYACPSACSDPSGLPPALIVTAELDPLRDEAEEYGQRLVDHGTPCTVVRFAGVGHGFLGRGDEDPTAGRALEETLSTLDALLPR